MKIKIEKSRLAVYFDTDGNCYGVIQQKSPLRKLLEFYYDWTNEELVRVKNSLIQTREDRKFVKTANSLIKTIDAVIEGRKKDWIE